MSFNATKTHCPQGHEYTLENTYIRNRPDGGSTRLCKQCKGERQRALRATLPITALIASEAEIPFGLAIKWDNAIFRCAERYGATSAVKKFGVDPRTVHALLEWYEARAA